MAASNQKKLARRGSGKPYRLKLAVAMGDADGSLAVPGIEYHDELVSVLEFANTAETAVAIAADHTANSTIGGNGTVTIAGGSTLKFGHSALVIYYAFD